MPLNLKYPPQRNTAICELADADVILADTAGQQWLDHCPPGAGPSRPVLRLTDEQVLAADPVGSLQPPSAGSDDVAYLLFTSGSTGRPKGVPIRHRNVLAFLGHTIPRYEVGPGCRMSHTFDLTFDLSVFDLFVTWGGGATLVVPEQAELLSAADYTVNRRLTHWFSVPSAVSAASELGGLPAGRATGLCHSVCCGEQFTYAQAEAWSAFAPESVVENIYGPTELTLACAEFRLPKERGDWPDTANDTVPIGAVYPGLEHVITDDGELCVRGPQRFDGYLDPLNVYTTMPSRQERTPQEYRRRVIDVARWTEQAGFRGALIYTDNTLVDAWTVAGVAIENSERFVPLVAVSPVDAHPFAVAKTISTLAFLHGRRVDLNLVTGGFSKHLRELGCETSGPLIEQGVAPWGRARRCFRRRRGDHAVPAGRRSPDRFRCSLVLMGVGR